MPYPNMPTLAPIGVRVDKYLDVPAAALGPVVDPAKGYRLERLGDGLYMITDGAYQSMFMTYQTGVVVVDGIEVTYSTGWQRGTQATGVLYRARFGTKTVREHLDIQQQ